MKYQADRKELKRFGLLVGGILSAIGLWLITAEGIGRQVWLVVLGVSLVLLGLLLPGALGPVYRVWMRVGHVLGWINTRIILGVIFYGLITPMGLIMRMLGKDSMRRVLIREAHSYRVARTARPSSHLRRQF